MEFRSFQRAAPSINLSALIDIIFILVIFVVLAANFDRLRDLDVTLPSAHATGRVEPRAVVVVIPQGGAVRVNEEAVAEADLQPRLRALRAEHEALVIAADRGVELERAVRVMGDASAAGFTAVSIATREAR